MHVVDLVMASAEGEKETGEAVCSRRTGKEKKRKKYPYFLSFFL